MKMYACRKPTRISNAVTPTFRANGPIAMIGALVMRVRGEQGERGEQDVARHHVGEKSDRQREGPHEQDLHELDGRHEDVEGERDAGREEVAGEVLDALVLEAQEPVQDVDHQRQEQRDRRSATSAGTG